MTNNELMTTKAVDPEVAKLRRAVYYYEVSRKRMWRRTFEKYDRMIAEEKAAQEAHDEKISLIMQGIALFLAGAGCMAVYLHLIWVCLGG